MQNFSQIIAQSEDKNFSNILGNYLFHFRHTPDTNLSSETHLYNYLTHDNFSRQEEHKKIKIQSALVKALIVYDKELEQNNLGFLNAKKITTILALLYQEKTAPTIHTLLATPRFAATLAQDNFFYNFYFTLSSQTSIAPTASLLNQPFLQPFLSVYFQSYEVLYRAHQKDDRHTQLYALDCMRAQYNQKNPAYAHFPLILALIVAQQEVVFSDKKDNKSELVQYALNHNLPLNLEYLSEIKNFKNNSHFILQKLLPPLFRKYYLNENNIQNLPSLIHSELLYYHLLSPYSTATQTKKLLTQCQNSAQAATHCFHSILVSTQKNQQFKEVWSVKPQVLIEQLHVLAQTRLDTSQLMVITNALSGFRSQAQPNPRSAQPQNTQKFLSFKSQLTQFLHALGDNSTRAVDYYLKTPDFLLNIEEKTSNAMRLGYPEISFALQGLGLYFSEIEKINVESIALKKKYSHLLVNMCDHFFNNNTTHTFDRLNPEDKKEVFAHIEKLIHMIKSPIFLSNSKAILMKKMLQKSQDFMYHNHDYIKPLEHANLYSVILACVDSNTKPEILNSFNVPKNTPTSDPRIKIIEDIKQGVMTCLQKYQLSENVPQVSEAGPKRNTYKI